MKATEEEQILWCEECEAKRRMVKHEIYPLGAPKIMIFVCPAQHVQTPKRIQRVLYGEA